MSNEQQCASQWGKDQSLKTAPNNSLDRRGVFRNIKDAAKVE
jgi:hypothetical protein